METLTQIPNSTSNISAYLDQPFDDLSSDEQRMVLQYAKLLKKVEEVYTKAKHENFDLGESLSRWLHVGGRKHKRPRTQTLYLNAIDLWLDWLTRHSLHTLDINAKIVDEYAMYVRRTYHAVSTQNLMLAAPSSFYSYLVREDAVTRNYFIGTYRAPKKKFLKTGEDIPTPAIVETILKAMEDESLFATGKGSGGIRKSTKAHLPVVHALWTYGIRVDAVPTFETDGSTWEVESKTRRIRGQLAPDTPRFFHAAGLTLPKPFATYDPGTIQKAFQATFTRYQQQGIIPEVYSPHDFRHGFAVEFYEATHDIEALSERLGHSDIRTTQIYLSGFRDRRLKEFWKYAP